MSFDYLNEAFKKLDLLNEETFDTSVTGLTQLSDFMSQDIEDTVVNVIDAEAKIEDDLQDSYIGKVITNCNVCHSHIFENKDEIVIDDEGLVNPDKQCPYCGETLGFVVVGEITPFVTESEEEAEPAEETSVNDTTSIQDEPVEDTIDEITTDEEQLEESVAVLERPSQKDLTQIQGTIADVLVKHSDEIDACGADESAVKSCIERILSSEEVNDSEAAQEAIRIINKCKGPKLWSTIGTYMTALKVAPVGKYAKQKLYASFDQDVDYTAEQYLDDIYQGEMFVDIEKIEQDIENASYDFSIEDVIAAAPKKGFKLKNISKETSSYYVLVHNDADMSKLLTATDEEDTLTESVNNVSVETDDSVVNVSTEEDGTLTVSTEVKEIASEETISPLSDDTIIEIEEANGIEEAPVEDVVTEEEPTEEISDEEQIEEGLFNKKTTKKSSTGKSSKVTFKIYDPNGRLQFNRTFDEIPGKKSASEQLRDAFKDSSTYNQFKQNNPSYWSYTRESDPPSSFDTKNKRGTQFLHDIGIYESLSAEDTDVEIEEVDELVFDELSESYLKEVYENVESFKTTHISSNDTQLVIEGIIKFRSGTEKKTGFIFEAHSVTEDGKVKFTGKNEHFSRGAKSFTLTGTVVDKKLISESFVYNYRAKTPDGKSNRVYGRISKR